MLYALEEEETQTPLISLLVGSYRNLLVRMEDGEDHRLGF